MDESDAAAVGATEVISWKVTPGREAEFEAWAHDLTTVATRQEGHLGATWLRPHTAGDTYHVVIRFSSAELLEKWMGSDERGRWIDKLGGIAFAESVRRTGMETWFSLPGLNVRPPPQWKMVVVTLAAIYPLSLLFNWLVAPSVRGFPLFLRALLFPCALVPLLTFVIMPSLSKLLRTWMYGRR
jgi:antibiotic biosynthesis monooxygenase (ABM) superfamily enzyme